MFYKFYYRPSKTSKDCKVYFKLRIGGKSTAIYTGISIDTSGVKGNKTTGAIPLSNKLKEQKLKDTEGKETDTTVLMKLTTISEAVTEMVKAGADREAIKEKISLIANAEKTKKWLEYKAQQEQVEKHSQQSVIAFLDTFVDEVENVRLTKSHDRFSQSSIRKWKLFQKVFKKYAGKRRIEWEKLDVSHFERYLLDDGQTKTSIGTQLSCLKMMCRAAAKAKLPVNEDALNYSFSIRAKEHEKITEVYLTAEEVKALYAMPLNGGNDRIRDVFLMGCFTAQRFSDYSRICKDNYKVVDGVGMIELIQQKTGKNVEIPILNDMTRAILKKYDFTLPKVAARTMNERIKEILKELSESVPSLAQKVPTMLRKNEREAEKKNEDVNFERNADGVVMRPKYELVTTHTARRTGATLMTLTQRYPIHLMKTLTGHSDYKTFEMYVKLSGKEAAKAMAALSKQNNEPF